MMRLFFLILMVLLFFHWFLSPKPLSPEVFNKPIFLTAAVSSIPINNKLGLRFLVHIKSINGVSHSGNIMLSYYRHGIQIKPGELWHFRVKLKPIHGSRNPGGFNTTRWASMQNVLATGYVIQPKAAKRISHHRFSVNLLRENIQTAIQKHIRQHDLAAVINALTIGSKNSVSPEAMLVFQRTGTSHLIAISGLHVGLVVSIAYFFFQWGLRCFPWLLLTCPVQRIAAGLSIIVAWLYGFLVGFSLPTQRAVIMITVFMLCFLIDRPISIWRRLLLAFFMVLALQPLAFLLPSFWLSFLAVFWMSYVMMGRTVTLARWKQWTRLQIALTLGLLPVTLYCFHQFSLLSMLSNLIAIPWVTLVIVPLCLLASSVFIVSKSIAGGIWWLAAKCFLPLWFFLQYLSHISWGQWLHPINDFYLLVCSLLGVLLLLAPRGFLLRPLGVVLILPLFFYFPARPDKNEVWLTVLDVGQGLSTVIQTAHHVMIYDTGPKFITGFDAGRSVLIPFLKTLGVKTINRLIISHGDNDHIGGSFWLVKHDTVQKILSSIPTSRWKQAYSPCYAGQQWQWDGVSFRVLWPPKGKVYEDNNSSCVLRISIGDHAALLTGDIEKPAEKTLVSQHVLLSSDVLVAPHHGSRSSSTPAFIQAVHPSEVILSLGYRNRYHFPAPSILQRYRAQGVQIFSTAKQGAIRVILNSVGSRIIAPIGG